MNDDDILDLSEFRLTRPVGKTYDVFDPRGQTDGGAFSSPAAGRSEACSELFPVFRYNPAQPGLFAIYSRE
jgi:hypothetical protein